MSNINKLQVKDGFETNGWCTFPINLIDDEFHSFIVENLKCNKEQNFRDIMREFRFDSEVQQEGGGGVQNNFRIFKDTHLELDKEKERLYELYKEDEISQLWYFDKDLDSLTDPNSRGFKYSHLTDPNSRGFKYSHRPGREFRVGIKSVLQNGIDNIVRFLYGFDEDFDMEHEELQLTYFNKNCRFGYHLDEEAGYEDGPICAVIIYLNEDYNRDNGGLLIFDGNEIVPELGTCAIMDLNNHDIWHGVTEVTGDLGRYAIFSFPHPGV